MSDNRNIGDQILSAVDDIIASGNFDKLNSVVSDTVYKALDEAQKQLAKVTAEEVKTASKDVKRAAKEVKSAAKDVKKATKSGVISKDADIYLQNNNAVVNKKDKKKLEKIKMRQVGRVSGILLEVFGGIGFASFGLVFLILLMVGAGFDFASGWLMPTAICAGLIWLGRMKVQRVKRAERYLYVMQGKTYINISDLAHLTNTTDKQIRKDLKKMIKLGIFPEGHLDWNEQCLMVNDSAYREYLQLEKRRYVLAKEDSEQHRFLEEQEQKTKKEPKAETPKEQAESMQETEYCSDSEKDRTKTQKFTPEELKEHDIMLEEGKRYIRQFRALNDAIEGEVISQKLFKLENLLKEIFEQIEDHPEQVSEMHKFMDYYLPTTLKLVQAYEEFDHVSVPGEDILSAKAEIEKTLDTINMAFAELLNKLFRDRAFDATTDAQVLKTMLAREGLTKEMQ